MKKTLSTMMAVGMAVSMLSACSGGDDASTADGGAFEGRGPITYVQGKDNSGKLVNIIDMWNKDHPDEEVSLVELSTEADQQRQSMIQNAQTESDAYCVLSVDNVWVSEFAANRWIDELPAAEFPKSEIMDPVWKTGEYRGKLYAMPHASDGGFLYYRKDLLEQAGITEAPKTWDDMEKQCEAVRQLPGYENIGCYGGQLAKYEGLTVNVDEAIHSAGGEIVNAEGKVVVDSPQARAGLQKLIDGFKSNFIPQEALTYKEEEGRAAFESDRLVFYRNWPYQYSLTQKTMDGKFGIAPMPGLEEGKIGASSLGGHNAAISSYCKNKATALDFVKFYTSKEISDYQLKEMSLAPTYTALYDDPKNIEDYPYLPVLKASIEAAAPRPQVANYGDVTAAIQDAVFPALKGEKTADEAIAQLSDKLNEIVK
ncbi:ABC transporter substrate-binding protein [Arcanobacterium phocisimile]|uniref:ABC transporter substrate-binding protein n=1 Tax=Arcanobacterium phocisimile TaxID=1302235 RepID=A0ABX7IHJ8_9ACTO|nr:ABC transporter substrate-binding protein [Arcanobacterium phocisimile]QRV01934.1 ABC transporter substrate-binding protein [Arcanobacterium phocisimile]